MISHTTTRMIVPIIPLTHGGRPAAARVLRRWRQPRRDRSPQSHAARRPIPRCSHVVTARGEPAGTKERVGELVDKLVEVAGAE